MRYYIDNKLAFWGALFAFVGSLFVTLDRLSYFQNHFSSMGRWKSIAEGLQKLTAMTERDRDGKALGIIRSGDRGFPELAYIVALNRPELSGKEIIAIARNAPVTLGELPIALIHVVTSDAPNTGKNVAFEFGLMHWIAAYRTEWFIYRGFALVSVGFFFGVLSRIKKRKDNPPNKAPEPTPGAVTPRATE